ncbi:MAG TPA: DHHA1 domain-containing protein [Phycisphaerales bacterium]|nr:DHHA1 domain-containing protein [Phycisphaerales bacterium]
MAEPVALLEEGYGLNEAALAELAGAGARVIVSVDCGIGAVGPALRARHLGLDLIITDHHELPPGGVLPEALALVHPRLPGSAYPFGDLCGAGVAYKLAWRLCTMHSGSSRVTPSLRTLLVELLALASLGVIADVVPLIGENRVIARHGLARIQRSPLPGLRALVRAAGLAEQTVEAVDVGFKLAPRLNACGRLGHARDAVELFTTAEGERAEEIAADLCRLNRDRQGVERGILGQAREAAERAGMTGPDRRAIVCADARWHAGVVGIVCARLVEAYCRPVILLQKRDGLCHGSGRSVAGFDLARALADCSGLLEKHGGHAMAAGLQLRECKLDEFVEAFTARANESLRPEDLCPSVLIDCRADLAELTPAELGRLSGLAPHGRGNPEVRLLVGGLTLGEAPRPLGAAARHLDLRVRAGEGAAARWLRLVAWHWGPRRESLRAGMRLDAVVEPKLSTFGGRTRVEGELRDLMVTAAP